MKFLFILFIFTFNYINAIEKKEYLFLGNHNIPPIIYLENDEPSGLVIDLTKAIIKEAKINAKIEAMDWKEAQDIVYNDNADALLQINSNPQRAKIYNFSKPLLQSDFTIFHKNTRKDIHSINSLFRKTVGVEAKGYPIALLKKYPQVNIQLLSSWKEGFDLINNDKIDALVVDKWVGEYVLSINKIEGITVIDKPIESSYSAIAVKKENQELLDKLNQGINAINTNGERERILQKWSLQEVVYLTKEKYTYLTYIAIFSTLLFVLFLILYIIKIKQSNKELESQVQSRTNELTLKNKQLLKEKNLSKNYLQIAGSAIIALDVKGDVILINQKGCEILGAKENQVVGKNWFDNFLVTEELDFVKNVFNQIINGELENVRYVENYIKTLNGEKRLIAWNNSITYDENNKIIGILSSGNDITEHRSNEIKIEEQKKEFESIFNYAKDGIAIVNLEGDFLKANRAFLDITGYDLEEILTLNCTELTVDKDKETNINAIEETIQKGYAENLEKACTRKDKTEINVTMSMSILPDNNSILIIIHDTTTLKLMQEQAKLSSLGEMIGNIAHQWRQPLSLITSAIGALKVQCELGEEITKKDIDKYYDLINDQSVYLSKTIDNFRDFIKEDISYTEINLNNTLNNVLTLIDASLKQNFITTVINIEDELYIKGNSNELSQAFINIFNNSKDVLKEAIKDEKDRFIFLSAAKTKSNTIEITIKDSGGGIEHSILDKVFEPYFTTKHKYFGTGLGLSMVYKIIVERHNGQITVHNEQFKYNKKEYKGAVFKINLPI